MAKEHVLLLGGTGETGIVFINQITALGNSAPLVTLYIRASGRSKLPATANDRPNIRIVEGGLTDRAALKTALSADGSFPQVTTVISFLGAYMSLWYFLTRQTPHPIADAFSSTILPAMQEVGVKRILALATPAFQYPEETKKMTWGVWLQLLMPKVVVPQGNAEMKYIANAVVEAGESDKDLEWTVYRVPMLNHGDANAVVSAGELFKDFTGTFDLSRGSLSKWLLAELVERKHVRRAPMVGNIAK